MKLICECGNIEDLKTDKLENFEFGDCRSGTIILVCKKCSKVVFINLENG